MTWKHQTAVVDPMGTVYNTAEYTMLFPGKVTKRNEDKDMELGSFSVSLSVKDLEVSKDFYEKLGFEKVGGDSNENWLILRNGEHVIGLFQGMFEKNILTFNPGWDQYGRNLDDFTDVRELQRELKKRGISLASEADEASSGPASCMITDPDGNPILIDQHR